MFRRFRLVHLTVLLLFNCSGGRNVAQSRESPLLDADLAFAHVRRLVEFGPRSVASEGHRRAVEYIESELKKLPVDVELQSFDAITPKGTLKMHNIIARQRNGQPGARSPAVILASHYDTKLAESFTFLGANDGGSSTGLLLELARVLAPRKSEFQYWFVFFDGEEAIREWTDTDSLYGSRQFVRELKTRGQLSAVKAFVLLDLVGDKNLNLRRDSYSTPWMVDLFWKSAAEGKYRGFAPTTLGIMDDHIPFVQEGIPAVDLIDYDFGPSNSYWHTAEDTLDKISADSLRQVGEVVLKTLPALERSLREREAK